MSEPDPDSDPRPLPRLSFAEASEAAAWFSRIYTGWTWPELLRALDFVLPPGLADEVAPSLLGYNQREPRHPAEAVVRALRPWTDALDPEPLTVTMPDESARDTIAHGLPPLYSVRDVAEWLDVEVGELEWFAGHGGWLRTASTRLRHYRVWARVKRDGVRVIEAPKPRLREMQRQILRQLVSRIPAHPAATGFVPGTSTADFAWPHSGKPTVLRVDLRHCFESITADRVTTVFHRAGYPQPVARRLAELCTTATPADRLRGAPSEHAAYLRTRHLPPGRADLPTSVEPDHAFARPTAAGIRVCERAHLHPLR